MKKVILFIGIILAFFAFIGCSSSDDNSPTEAVINKPIITPPSVVIPPATPSISQFRNFQIKQEKKLVQNLEANGDNIEIFKFKSAKGAIISANKLTYTKNNVIYFVKKEEKVQLKFIELYNRAEMILTNRVSMGTYSGGNRKSQLATAGEFFMELEADGKPIKDFQINLLVPTKNSGNLQSDLKLSIGNINANNDITYTEVPANTKMNSISTLFIYGEDFYNATFKTENNTIFNSGKIGWINYNKYIPAQGETTSIVVKAPQGYNDSNSAIYFIDKNMAGVGQLDSFITHSQHGKTFSTQNNWMPIGTDATLVFVTIDPKSEELIYALKTIKVEHNKLYTFDQNELKQSNVEEFSKLINRI